MTAATIVRIANTTVLLSKNGTFKVVVDAHLHGTPPGGRETWDVQSPSREAWPRLVKALVTSLIGGGASAVSSRRVRERGLELAVRVPRPSVRVERGPALGV